MGSRNQYQNQLRRKIADAEDQYRALGGTKIEIAARERLPGIRATLRLAKEVLDKGKESKKFGDIEIDLVALKNRVRELQLLSSGMGIILAPPRRKTLTTHTYYATISTRVLDFDGSDPSARQFGGTIVSHKTRIDVPADQADRDLNFNPKRESHTSDITDEVCHLQARLQWLRNRIAAVNTAGSVEQWLLTR